jgi:hypothetical protein
MKNFQKRIERALRKMVEDVQDDMALCMIKDK